MVFPTRRVDRSRAQQFEQLGSKPKYWFREGDRRLLFKAENRGTGEDWAEVVASRLCRLLGIPHVEYELAEEFDGDESIRPGVVCQNMAPPPKELHLGNQLLYAVDPGYDVNAKRNRAKRHTVSEVCRVLRGLSRPEPAWAPSPAEMKMSALDVFVGYVLLDVWIANQDRHHENWDAIWDGTAGGLLLAPTFDHGAGLARNVRDTEREERLATRDRN